MGMVAQMMKTLEAPLIGNQTLLHPVINQMQDNASSIYTPSTTKASVHPQPRHQHDEWTAVDT